MIATPRTLLVTALHAEAAPLVRRYGLTKDTRAGGADTFYGDTLSLIVTGVGKLRSAVETAAFLARQGDLSGLGAVNIGIAGVAPSGGFAIGELCLVHRIVDRASGRERFPDMLVETGIREASLVTCDRPVTRADPDVDGLVDMEAAGFFEAAAAFLSPHRIACLKVVSDHLDGRRITREEISGLVEARLPAIGRFIDLAQEAHRPKPPVLGTRDRRWLEVVITSLRLTESQARQLEESAAAYRVCRKRARALPELPGRLLLPPQNKEERSARLAAIRKALGGKGASR